MSVPLPDVMQWENLPDRSTPANAQNLNQWSADVKAVAQAGVDQVTAARDEIDTNILSWATSTPAVAAALPYIATRVSYLPIEEKLDDWWAALAAAGTTKAQAVLIGDSITEGAGASSVTLRWQTLLQGAIRRGVGLSRGATFPFIPGFPATGSGWPVARAGNVVANQSYGLGWRTAVIQDITGTLTFTFTGTSAQIMYVRASATGVMSIVVDGGAPVTLDTNPTTSGLPASNAALWSTGALTSGAHTITITRDPTSAAGQHPYIQGLLTFDGDETVGVRVLDAGHSGYSSNSAVSSTRETMLAVATAAAGGASLAFIALGTNDTAGPTSNATYKANVLEVIVALRAAGFAGSIVLLNAYKGNTLDQTIYSGYGDQLASIAAADAKVSYFDLRRRMPDVATPYTDVKSLGLFADTLHPSDDGHTWIARVLADYLLPRA